MRFDSLQQWLDWQETLHPSKMDFDLERIREVWILLGAPVLATKVVTVGGTNGKGSCIAYLQSIYIHAGYSVGAYTSPHLHSYTERIRLQGQEANNQELCEIFDKIDRTRGEISLTYFEFGTLAAFVYFSRRSLVIVLLEVGLGGRLDAVNIIDAEIALISSIGIDHQQWLGATREKIGFEKAGIFRPDKPAVYAQPDAPDSVIDYALKLGVNLLIADKHYTVENIENSWAWISSDSTFKRDYYGLPVPSLRGDFQLRNAAAVIAVIDLNSGDFPVSTRDIREGLMATLLPGRFEVWPGPVDVIFDVAHNQESARALAQNLRSHQYSGKTRAIFSLLNDKDIDAILSEVWECIEDWHVVLLNDKRAMDLNTVATQVRARKLHGDMVEFFDVEAACDYTFRNMVCGDRVVIFGSFGLVSQAREIWSRLKQSKPLIK